MIDAGYPAWQVAYDGRYYRYSSAEWDRYRGVASGATTLPQIETAYRPVAFVLSPAWNAPLIAALRAQPRRWQQLSADGTAVVFKRTAAPQS